MRAEICAPHRCRYGADIGERGLRCLSCQLSAGRFPRHEFNSAIKRGLATAGILEPAGLDRGDGRRPDGMTTFPYAEGKYLVWDASCVDTFSASPVKASAARATGCLKSSLTDSCRLGGCTDLCRCPASFRPAPAPSDWAAGAGVRPASAAARCCSRRCRHSGSDGETCRHGARGQFRTTGAHRRWSNTSPVWPNTSPPLVQHIARVA